MRFFYILLLAILLTACGETQIEKQVPQSSQALSVYPMDQRVDRETYAGFLDLIVRHQDIPREMISKHTLLGNPQGFFYGKDQITINEQVQALILHQQTPTSRRHYLLTTDGKRTIDQRLITENYELNDLKVSSSYKIDHEGRILCTTRRFAKGKAPRATSTAFGVLENGEIVKVTL
ncbi:MAG: hypothetical protein AAFR59_03885 [Bacteroidota bacterium]